VFADRKKPSEDVLQQFQTAQAAPTGKAAAKDKGKAPAKN